MTNYYYCKRCKDSFPAQMIILHNSPDGQKLEKPETIEKTIIKEGFSGRFLTCNHAISLSDLPFSDQPFYHADQEFSKEVLIERRKKIYMEFLKLSDEQRINLVQFHNAQYEQLLQAAKLKKYDAQIAQDLWDRYKESLPLVEKAKLDVKFAFLNKAPEKRLELIAKDKLKIDKKEANFEDAIAQLQIFARKVKK